MQTSPVQDRLARTVLDLLTETTSRQISREIAHLADIGVDTSDDGTHIAPPGLLMPASGAITTLVVATSRDHPDVSEEMRVAVWPVAEGDDPAFVVTLSGSDRTLPIALREVQPELSAHLRGQVNDFVAATIAQVVTELNVGMQRTYIRESHGDEAEYTED
ncbi:hypothetical protein GCM10022234_18700 [Aeromicrobium panaciterrae]|uniref:hypothetical protein n=1 Tax=Aeromicrobium panaciterrae TaxID=363861 RepID=UPI0031DB373E